jgi:flagellar biosynthetic protein FliQ
MNPETAIETSREAIKVCIMVGGPILAICLIVGLLMGLAQAMSHIQDQAIATVPKLLAIFVAVGFALPWMSETLADFSKEQFGNPFLSDGIGSQSPQTRLEARTASTPESARTNAGQKSVFPTLNAAPLSTSSLATATAGNSPFKPASFDRQARNTVAPNSDASSASTTRVNKKPQFNLPSTGPAKTTSPNPFSLPSFRFSRSDDSNLEG